MSVSVSGINTFNLPYELWERVFSYDLSLEDLKNVRSMCRLFYDACCSYRFHKKEQMVFDGNFYSNRALQSVIDLERKVWNIKLHDVPLDESVLPFFEKHGANIHSLMLTNCKLKPEILRNIIVLCSNLHSFSMRFTTVKGHDHKSREAAYADFEELQSKGTVFNSVTNLTLELISVVRRAVTKNQLFHILAVFPNIKNLSLTIFLLDHHLGETKSRFSHVTAEEVLSPAFIYEQLEKIRHQLEELNLFIWEAFHLCFVAFESLSKISSIEMKNLKKLRLNCNFIQSTRPHPDFQHLTDLDCVISHKDGMSVSAKVLFILNSATKLNSLTIKVMEADVYPFKMSEECFVALLKSQLKTLNIWKCNDFFFRPDHAAVSAAADFEITSSNPSLSPNYTLTRAEIETDDLKVMFLFSKYFPCVESMCVKNAREDILHNIFHYQTKLRSLALYHCERYPLSRMRPKGNPFECRLRNLEVSSPSQLENLTHFRIVDNISLDLTQFMLSKFVFSKLRSFTILMEDKYPTMDCDIDALWQLFQKLTQLQYLEISWRTVATFQQWLTLFESLPSLRHFSCTDSSLTLFDDSEYRHLFHIRSSLRLVDHKSKKFTHSAKYVYDVISNSVECVQSKTG